MNEREPTTVDEMRRAMDVFLAICELDGAARARELERRTADDPDLRRRVERLLEADAVSCWLPDDLDDSTTLDVSVPAAPAPPPEIDGYELIEELGGGGMAIVYRAEQQRPIRRTVAVKVLRPGFDDTPTQRRFELEQHLLARMNHASIAQVFDAGTTRCGRPFVSMEFIDGPTVTAYCRDAKLSIRERLRLFLRICNAVSHAHRHGVLHRDLKPSNILVADGPEGATPKVIDFGIAKTLSDPIVEAEGITLQQRSPGLLGTPEYMSPEQVLGNVEVDVRSDVFSLGIMLVELLLGALPDHRRRRRSLPLDQLVDEVRSREEPRLADLAAKPAPAALRGDLQWIVQRALELEPDRRYESVSAFADDLRRHLEHRPVVAAPPDAFRRALRFARRNRRGVTVLAILILSLLTGAASVVIGFLEVREQRALAEWNLYVARVARASASLASGNTETARHDLDACDEKHRHWEWQHLALRSDLSLAKFDGPEWQPTAFATSPDDRYVAVGTWIGRLWIWDLHEPEAAPRRTSHELGAHALAYAPDGNRLAWTHRDGTISILDPHSMNTVATLEEHDDTVVDLVYSPDGTRLYTAGLDATLRVWDTATFEVLQVHRNFHDQLTAVDVSPDGSRIAVIGRKALLHVWSLPDFAEHREMRWNRGSPFDLEFSADGSHVFTTATRHVQVWDAETGTYDVLPHEYESNVLRLAVSPDGERLAVTTMGPKLSIVELESQERLELQGHHRSITGVAFLERGNRVATTSDDETLRIWDPELGPSSIEIPHRNAFEIITSGAQDETLITATHGQSDIQIWDRDTGDLIAEVVVHDSPVFDVKRLPDGRILTTGDERIALWSADGSHKIRDFDIAVRVGQVEDDGRRFVASDWGEGVLRVDLETGETLWRTEIETHTWYHPEKNVAVHGSFVLVAGCDTLDLRKLDLETGEEIARIPVPIGKPMRMAIHPEGERVAAATYSRIYVLDLRTGEPLQTLRSVGGRITKLAYSSDGRRLFVSTERPDCALHVYDAATGDHLLRLPGDGTSVKSFAIFDREQRIALATNGGSLLIYETSLDALRTMNRAARQRDALRRLAEERIPHTESLDDLTTSLIAEAVPAGIERKAVNTVVAALTPRDVASILREHAWETLSVWGRTHEEYRRAAAWAKRTEATARETEDRYIRILAAYRTGRWLDAYRATADLNSRLVPRYGRFISPVPIALARAWLAHRRGHTETAERILDEGYEFMRGAY